MTEALKNSLLSGKYNGYPPAVGYESAREAIAERYSRPQAPLTKDDVVIASGCSGALEMAISVLAHEGQTILLPQPGFSLYKTICDNKGIRTKYYNLLPESNWEIDLEHLNSLIDETVVAWLINNPSNPCGSVYSREHLSECKKVAAMHKLTIIADEIYEDMVFGEGSEFIPLAVVQPSFPMLTCGGLAKRFMVPGWRVGWILINEPSTCQSLSSVRKGLVDLAGLILGANSLAQGALPEIFENVTQADHESINSKMGNNAQIVFSCLKDTTGLTLVQPQGAFYMMVGVDVEALGMTDDVQVCERLIAEESVVCLPGCIFGMPNYIRLVYCGHPSVIEEACFRIRSFCQRHHQ